MSDGDRRFVVRLIGGGLGLHRLSADGTALGAGSTVAAGRWVAEAIDRTVQTQLLRRDADRMCPHGTSITGSSPAAQPVRS